MFKGSYQSPPSDRLTSSPLGRPSMFPGLEGTEILVRVDSYQVQLLEDFLQEEGLNYIKTTKQEWGVVCHARV